MYNQNFSESRNSNSSEQTSFFTSGTKRIQIMFDEGSSKGMPYYKYREELEGLKIRLKVEHLFDENEGKATCPFIDPSTKTKVLFSVALQ